MALWFLKIMGKCGTDWLDLKSILNKQKVMEPIKFTIEILSQN
jgi:hypothetical protein